MPLIGQSLEGFVLSAMKYCAWKNSDVYMMGEGRVTVREVNQLCFSEVETDICREGNGDMDAIEVVSDKGSSEIQHFTVGMAVSRFKNGCIEVKRNGGWEIKSRLY